MKLTYVYHSGFAIEGETCSIIMDYYKDSDNDPKKGYIHNLLISNPKKLYVLSSHSHPDHFNPDILEWKSVREDITYIFSKEILEARKAKANDAYYLDKFESFSDLFIHIKAFGSTDIGCSFLINAEKKTIFHAGDLNNWHWNEESSQKEINDAENAYYKELNLLSSEIKHLDLAMFPIDPRLGKDYMKGAVEFINTIPTIIFAPMHFDNNYDKLIPFEKYAEEAGCESICWTHKGEYIIF